MNIILLGAPGSGKGTQASMISERYGLPHISTGDIFRANIKAGTDIGKVAESYIKAGKLVPDEVTCEIVKRRLAEEDCKNGYLLDGFPRNIYQAEVLDSFAKIDLCININIDHALLMDRLCGRRVCAKCGESYHVSTLGGATTCAKCGGELIQRKDDNPETVSARLAVYNDQTAPLINYYTDKEIIFNCTGTEAPASTLFAVVSAELDKFIG